MAFLISPQAMAASGNSYSAKTSAKNSAKPFREGEILVKFKKNASNNAKLLMHAKHGATRVREFKRTGIEQIKLPKGGNLEKAIAEYRADPDVAYAEPNYIYSIDIVPNDTYFGIQYALRNTGQSGGTPGADISAPEAWDIETGSPGVVIAVIDTGVDYAHPDLAGNIWDNPFEIAGNGIDDDGNGYIDDIHGIDAFNNDADPMDDHGHGTHVAGTIGATGNNGTGVAGVNWNVSIMALKFLGADGSGSSSDAITCLEYIADMKANGVNIVATNNSWGGGDYSQLLRDTIDAQREILFFAAAGNDGIDNDPTPHYPSSYALPSVIAVASTDRNDALATDSCYGRRSVDIAAPGVSIASTLSSVNAYGLTAQYVYMSGTSMATPHATGAAGLLYAQNPSFTWIEVRNLILSSGDDTASVQGKTLTGKRLNAYDALTCFNKSAFSVLEDPGPIAAGAPAFLSALSINCELPEGPVSVDVTDGGNVYSIYLNDDGLDGDALSGDGVFSGTWTPLTGNVELAFSSPAGSEIITPLSSSGSLIILPGSLSNGYIGQAYGEQLTLDNGVCPCDWSISSGALPPGLSLDAASGLISGNPTQTGSYDFIVAVQDASLDTGARAYTATVVVDTDGDGVPDGVDNCINIANAAQTNSDGDSLGDACDNCTLAANEDQYDSNGDGYGNMCDGDLNNDGNTSFLDLGLFKAAFGRNDTDPEWISAGYVHADLDGNGSVSFLDLGIFKSLFGKPPGPAGPLP